MTEQMKHSRLQINQSLKNASVNIELEPEARRDVYRLSNRLAQKTIEAEHIRRLADALGYTDPAPMLAGIKALTDLLIPVQHTFDDIKYLFTN